MNRYMPLTGHDSTVPALLIDTQAPLDVLHDAAVYRIRAVTQLLENLAFREQLSSDAVVPWCCKTLPIYWRFRCAMGVICWM